MYSRSSTLVERSLLRFLPSSPGSSARPGSAAGRPSSSPAEGVEEEAAATVGENGEKPKAPAASSAGAAVDLVFPTVNPDSASPSSFEDGLVLSGFDIESTELIETKTLN